MIQRKPQGSCQLSEYINGRKSPTIGNAILIADALNISLDDLVGRKWDTCRVQKKPGEYTDELSETLNKLTEKECIFAQSLCCPLVYKGG
ncbi:helix-turn-helix domain-containing protein [Enterocloster clostridioformis]|uniref:helix-turn-helix domain-containing protein n=1 Tax=Enterocloster clostridioformis TaxID=1531 RepID=UPI0009B7E533